MNVLTLLTLSLFTSMASAVQVEEARYVPAEHAIELDVIYSGGCAAHAFELQAVSCIQTRDNFCVSELVDNTTDTCRMVIETTIKVPAPDFSAFKISDLMVVGDEGSPVPVEFAQ